MKCPNCSYENLPGAPFCENCGEVLFPDDPATTSRMQALADVPAVVQVPAVEPARGETGPTAPVPGAPGATGPLDVPAVAVPPVPEEPDLSGLEQLVGADYVPPEPANVHAGDTAELPVIEGGYVPRARNYTLTPTPKEQRQRDREQRRLEKKLQKEREREERAARRDAPADDAGEAPEAAPAAATAADPEAPAAAKGKPAPASEPRRENPASAAAKARPRRPRSVIVAAVALAVALLAAGIAGGTYAAELWGGRTVPAVDGLAQDAAAAELEQRGFAVQTADVKSDEPAGVVLGCEPAAGQRAPEGSTVTLSVAVPRIVPDIKGLTQAEAEQALAAEGLTAVEFVEKKSNKDEGIVLSVKPKAGEEVQAGTPVTVKVSVPYTVPQVEGKPEAEAVKALEDEGYEVSTAWYDTEDIPEGTAVSTEPAAGTKLDSGSEVTLYIARDRGAELRDLTASVLPGATLTKDGATYEVQAVKSVSYLGENKVSYTVTAKQFEVVTLPFDLGQETYYKDEAETIEGEITWSDANKVKSASPSISY